MLIRISALLMVLLFAGQALADGIVCGIDVIGEALTYSDETASCPMKGAGDCDKMACCARGRAPTGSRGAMICCEVKCGESTGGAQLGFAPPAPTQAPPIIPIRHISSDPGSEAEISSLISFKSAGLEILDHDPPELFLQNSALLI
jgi:hypothetical protein